MPTKRTILAQLYAEELRANVDYYELQVADLRQAGRRAGVVTVACLSSLLQVVLQNTQPARQRARIRNAERLYAAPPPVRIGET